jgi:hypothetical protein
MERVKREFVVERHAVTSVVIYEVTGEDLEQLEKETLTVGEDFSFALAASAVAISFTITLSTVTIAAGKTYDVFWIVMLGSYVAATFFGVRWFNGRKQFKGVVKKIRERGGPLGEEGKEVVESVSSVTVGVVTTETTKAGER